MCGLPSLFIHASGDGVQRRDSAHGEGRGRRPSRFSSARVQPLLCSLPLGLVSTGRRPTLRTYALTHCRLPSALCPPPASRLLALSLHPLLLPSQLPVPRQTAPFSPPPPDNVTSTQPHQRAGCWARLRHSPAITITITIATLVHRPTTAHELQPRQVAKQSPRCTVLHTAASVFLTALRRQRPPVNLFCTRRPFQPSTQAWS